MRANGRKKMRKKELAVWFTKYAKYIYFAELIYIVYVNSLRTNEVKFYTFFSENSQE